MRDLDNDDVAVRDAATRTILAIGEASEPVLLQALSENNSPEVKNRINRILKLFGHQLLVLKGEPLRRWRAIQVLERIGSKEAREVLKMLEREAPSLQERQEAKAALGRLDNKIKTESGL